MKNASRITRFSCQSVKTALFAALLAIGGCDIFEGSEKKEAKERGFSSVEVMRQAKSEGYFFGDTWKKFQEYENKKKKWEAMNREYNESLVDVIPRRTVICSDVRDMVKAAAYGNVGSHALQMHMPVSCDYVSETIQISEARSTFHPDVYQAFAFGESFYVAKSSLKEDAINFDRSKWGLNPHYRDIPSFQEYVGSLPLRDCDPDCPLITPYGNFDLLPNIEKDQAAYALGFRFGKQMQGSVSDLGSDPVIGLDTFILGLKDGIARHDPRENEADLEMIISDFQERKRINNENKENVVD